MNRYEVKNIDKNKNYGIYETLSGDFCYRNLGAIGENRYCFDIGITSFEGKKYEFERTLGDYLFDFSITNEKNKLILSINYVNREDNQDINLFQYDSLIGVINEGIKYIETDKDLIIILPSILFKDNISRILDTKDKNFVSDINETVNMLEDMKNKISVQNNIEEDNSKKVLKIGSLFKKKNKQ